MDCIFISVLLLSMYFATAMESNCSNYNESKHCNTSSLTALNTTFCYIYDYDSGKDFVAIMQCNADSKNHTFNCTTTGSNKNWQPTPSCSQASTLSTTTTTAKPSVTPAATTPSPQSFPTTHYATTVTSEEIATSDTTEMSTIPTTAGLQSSTGTPESASSTRKQTTETTSTQDNTSLSTRELPATSEDSGPIVIATVSVFVVVIIALAVVVGFLLWRQRRLKQQHVMGGNSGTSISNRSYEDDYGLERHISLLDMRPDDSVDSGYAEISPGNLNVERSPDNVYHTIDNLPEEKAERDNSYGHLKIQTTTFIGDNYSHVTVNQNSKPLSDATYAHTRSPTNAQEIKESGEKDTNYNHLEKYARETQGLQHPLKKDEREIVDDGEAAYNHAKAGQITFEPDSKGDTYSHLNQTWQRLQANQQNGSKFLTQGSKPQIDTTIRQKLDSDNTFPEYAKCAKKFKERQSPKPVGRDGYETPTGTANIYFTLEPEKKPSDTDNSFQVTNETLEDSESAKSPYHQYFILEKTDTDT